jgi:hypothetical protein
MGQGSGEPADVSRLHPQAREALDANLMDGERVEVVIRGDSSQAVIATDRRVFVFKKGFMAGATFGSELTSWDYRNLVGVQLHTGMLSGAVVLQAPGQPGTRTSAWSQGDEDPYKAPNAIVITRPWDQAERGVARIRELLALHHTPAPATSLADELRKLADLRDDGVLTDEEFAAAKRRLLG